MITPDLIKKAATEIQTGERFCLSLPLDLPGGNLLNANRHPPKLQPTMRGEKENSNYLISQDFPQFYDVISDDAVFLHTQYSTQWDGLSHVGQEFDADDDGVAEVFIITVIAATSTLANLVQTVLFTPGALGIDSMAEKGVQGRGVMIDLVRHFDREAKSVGYDDLMRVMEQDDVTVELEIWCVCTQALQP